MANIKETHKQIITLRTIKTEARHRQIIDERLKIEKKIRTG